MDFQTYQEDIIMMIGVLFFLTGSVLRRRVHCITYVVRAETRGFGRRMDFRHDVDHNFMEHLLC